MLKVFDATLGITQNRLGLLTPSLPKNDATMREHIKLEEMCCVALRYFASGESFRLLEYQFRIIKKAVSYIIEEVVVAIIKFLGETRLNTLVNADEWFKISQKVKDRWNFPNDINAVDGKQIISQEPKNSDFQYQKYKETNSIILLAIFGLGYEYLFGDVVMNGRNSDGRRQTH